MNKIIGFFIKYPFWTYVFMWVTLLVGLTAYNSTKRSLFPERKIKDIYVDVVYPGASPEEMEESVTNKIEDNLRGIVGIDEILSTSSENLAKVHVITTNRADVDEVLTDVKNAVDQINSFPSGAENPRVYKSKPLGSAMFLTLTGEKNPIRLKEVAERIYDDFLGTGFMSQVIVAGLADPEIAIELKEEALEKYQLTLNDINTKVRTYNRDLTIGSIKSIQQEYFLRFKNKSVEVKDLKLIPITTFNGAEILLGDVAHISYQVPSDQPRAVFNGETCVNINVFKLPEEDIIEITDYLSAYVKEFNVQNSSYQLHILRDASESVKGRINLLLKNGIIGLVLVVVVLGIFLNFRLSFWVALGIPISFFGMFIVTSFLDITINQISLFGMILVIGILVDDGIVISENIYTKLQEGMNPKDAAIKGTMEVFPAVFTSVLTTILVFSTFFFIDGNIGDIIPEMGLVVMACLGYSLLEATLILPSHLNSKKIISQPRKIKRAINKGVDTLRNNWYQKYLRFALEWRWASLAFSIFIVAIGFIFFLSDKIGKSFFPALDSNIINVEVAYYPGQSSWETEKYLSVINKEIIEITDSVYSKKSPILSTRYTVGASSIAKGNHAGTVEIRLRRSEDRDQHNSEISKLIREELNLSTRVPRSTVGGRISFGKPISYRLVSKNKDQLIKAKTYFLSTLNGFNQVTDITDSDESGAKEIEFQLSDKAINLGFTPDDIVNELRRRFFGTEIQKLQKRSKEVKVWVRLDQEQRNQLFSLQNVKIKKGDFIIPLTELASWNYTSASTSIKHYNGAKEVLIEGSNASPTLPMAPIITEIDEIIIPETMRQFPEVRFELGGQAKSQKKFNSSAITLTGLILMVIYFIIALTFRSWAQPIIVILMIIPSVAGAFIGHYIEDTFVVIMSYLGCIALVGIIVNDAVVFIDKFNQNIRSGINLIDALVDAGSSRFRAIILTSITTMAGLYPMVFENSTQAQFLIPMAITVTYGVFFGTLMILLFLPVFLACLNDFRRVIHWIWNGEWIEGAELEPSKKELKRLKKEGYED